MIKVLSIDFDYFIDVTSEDRDRLFPRNTLGGNLEEEWVKAIKLHPEILDIGVIENLDKLGLYLSKNSKKSIIEVSENHSDICNMLNKIPDIEVMEIVNVDFHHDYYHANIMEGVNSSNWLRVLKERRPNTKINWVRREDSQLESLDGVFPYSHICNIDNFLKEKYDYIFICFSPEWTPPHLRIKYSNLLLQLKGEVEYAE